MADSYRYRPAPYFACAYVVTWVLWFIGAYLAQQEGRAAYSLVFNLLGLLLGPTGVALFFVLVSGNSPLKRDYWDRIINLGRIRPFYLLIALVLPFVLLLTAIWLSTWLGQPPDQFSLAGGTGLWPMIVIAMIIAPILEEAGWHGYGVDSLRARAGMLKATSLFAVLWCVWHAPLVLITGTYQHSVAQLDNPLFVINFFVSILPAAFVANWLYYKNRRSIVGAILVHSMLNGSAVLLNAGQVAKCIATILYVVVAVAIVAWDREFRQGPNDFLR